MVAYMEYELRLFCSDIQIRLAFTMKKKNKIEMVLCSVLWQNSDIVDCLPAFVMLLMGAGWVGCIVRSWNPCSRICRCIYCRDTIYNKCINCKSMSFDISKMDTDGLLSCKMMKNNNKNKNRHIWSYKDVNELLITFISWRNRFSKWFKTVMGTDYC